MKPSLRRLLRIGLLGLLAALLALGVSWAVEFAQLSTLPAWLSSQHPLLRWIFGESFRFYDLPSYAAGVALAAGVHAAACSPRGAEPHAQ